MHGLIFEVLEDWVVEDYGTDAWHTIKEKAGVDRKDKGYLRSSLYEDQELIDLVVAASELLNTPADDIVEAYGRRFLKVKLFNSGYSELLKRQGSTLRTWLSNLNAMHAFIGRSFPGDNFIAPVFWCEDCDEVEGSILLHYYSQRGTVLVPMVVGLVEELALRHFHLEVKMHRTSLQGEDGATFTTWRIEAVDPSQTWKLSPKHEVQEVINFDGVAFSCPFSGKEIKGGETAVDSSDQMTPTTTSPSSSSASKCPFHHKRSQESTIQTSTEYSRASSDLSLSISSSGQNSDEISFQLNHLNRLFPFHILVDDDFVIIDVGQKLPKLLNKAKRELQGSYIGDTVKITRPVMVNSWNWKSLNKLSDQDFDLTPVVADNVIRFKASMFRMSDSQVLLTLSPNVKNVTELGEMGLTLSDLPLSTCQRDAVYLGEHIAQEVSRAHELDKLTKKLTERDLSKILLNSMLPEKVAEDLIQGKTVEPKFHEDVTLFFSDVVGFTTICDQVQPQEVIDMMNKLFSMMDHLAKIFDLYKVETVGDAYMCCAGLPEPDELHAEKVANFALGVLECAKLVKSPVDGKPIQLRIGIHTGSCTSGVVGSLTPHYALFGDMVNTTSRHESTGVAGKIQCSSILHDRLEFASPMDSPQFTFKARGLVDMKGKGEYYTYWLESATDDNFSTNQESMQSLIQEVEEMLACKTWKNKSYFGESFFEDEDENTVATDGGNSIKRRGSNVSLMSDALLSLDGDESISQHGIPSCCVLEDSPEANAQCYNYWVSLTVNSDLSQDEAETAIFDALSRSLEPCVQKKGKRIEAIQEELRAFVSSLSAVYVVNSGGHKLHEIITLMMRGSFLWEARVTEDSLYDLGKNPWDYFVLLFSAFIYQVKHTGSTNATLEKERHMIAQMYEGLPSCQQRRSVDYTFSILEDEFGELYEEITFGCPNFRSLVLKTVLSTDLESEAAVHSMLRKCEDLNATAALDERTFRQRNSANIGLLLAMSTIAPVTQSQDRFIHFVRNQYQLSHPEGCSEEKGESWYYYQTMFLKDSLLPLIEQILWIIPRATCLKEGAMRNIDFWEKKGKVWLTSCQLQKAALSSRHVEKLVTANADVLESLLLKVAGGKDVLDPIVRSELHEFVKTIASGYDHHKFHNWLHASHVAHLSNLLVKASDESNDSVADVVQDPLARFAIVVAALAHDVDHCGIPNGVLALEEPDLADKYDNKSIAERNSIDTAWKVLTSRRFKNLQQCIFKSDEEKQRFRDLFVKCIMATDIFDQDLRAERKENWGKAFSSDETSSFCKSTIYIEHIMQASDVAHTMQDWEIYRHWNENLFLEMYEAYNEGRDEKDPYEKWYEDELWFFDNWVIPLAQSLKTCGVLDIVSDQLVNQARSNRQRWELEGRMIVEEMLSVARSADLLGRPSVHSRTSCSVSVGTTVESYSSATFLASQMVTEAESLSKVMNRYERKYESVLGNLIALAYRGQPPVSMDPKSQQLTEIHKHFQRQEWYRSHIDEEKVVRRASTLSHRGF